MKLEVKKLVHSPVRESETFDLNLSDLPLDEGTFARQITGELKLTKLEDELLGKFEGKANLTVVCDRCAGDYELELPLVFSQEYLLAPGPHDEEKLEVSKTFEIEVAEPIRQEIIAGLPVKKLCKVDCAGVCVGCGQNLNEGKCHCRKIKDGKV